MFNYEVICIGAGPANLAVACALEDLTPRLAEKTLLLESADEIKWQRGLLNFGAKSQVSYLKDLATLRSPQSRFTFVNFLHDVGRLNDFINMGSTTAYREEISQYYQWAIAQLRHVKIQTSCKVVSTKPVKEDGVIKHWVVETEKGQTYTCRNIIFGTGRDPHIPQVFQNIDPDKLIHSFDYEALVANKLDMNIDSVGVIGAAQSAAEMLQSIKTKFPQASTTMIMRSIGLLTYDSSKFTNELFDDEYIDQFFDLPEEQRAEVLAQMHKANYSGIAPQTHDSLYTEKYLEKLYGRQSTEFLTSTSITKATQTPDGKIRLEMNNIYNGNIVREFDLLLLGTGYKKKVPELIKSLCNDVGINDAKVDRYYQLQLDDKQSEAVCFIQGVNEQSHGIADSLLSVQASRAKEIVEQIIKNESTKGLTFANTLKKFNSEHLIRENGLLAKRLLPFPAVLPFESSWCVIEPGTSSNAHTHHEREIFVAISGTAKVEVNGELVEFKEGDTVFFDEGQKHRVVNDSEQEFVMYSIWWDSEMCERAMSSNVNNMEVENAK